MSSEKTTLPGAKQVYRHYGSDGKYAGDTLALANEPAPSGGDSLLVEVMRGGARNREGQTDILVSQTRAKRELEKLGEEYKRLSSPACYSVQLSETLSALLEQVRRERIA